MAVLSHKDNLTTKDKKGFTQTGRLISRGMWSPEKMRKKVL